MHAMHYNIDLVVITTSSVYCDRKEKNKQTDKQNIKHQTSKPKKQMKKIKERKQRINKNKFSEGSNLGPLDVESLA